jgi:hypothetical protein
LAGAGGDQPFAFQVAVGLEDGVGVDAELGDDLLGGGELVAGSQQPQPECPLDLVDELEVGPPRRVTATYLLR